MSYTDKTKAYYAQQAKVYTTRTAEWRWKLLGKYNRKGYSALDIGCGTGNYLLALPNRKRTGIDLSKESLSVLKHREEYDGSVKVVYGNVCKMPFKTGSFDIAFSFSTLYYVKELEKACSEISRVLAPGGVAILEFGNRRSIASPWDRLMFDVPQFHFTQKEVRRALTRHGLEVEKILYRQLIPNFFRLFDRDYVKCRLLQPFAFRMVFVVRKV